MGSSAVLRLQTPFTAATALSPVPLDGDVLGELPDRAHLRLVA
jgi:hypothetical protein